MITAGDAVNCGQCRRCLEGVIDPHTKLPVLMGRMIVCPICGDKRCPKADDCINTCPNPQQVTVEDRLGWTITDNARQAIEIADLKASALSLTQDETEQLIKMVRARILCNQAFHQPYPELTVLVAKLLNWSHNVGPGIQRGGKE